MSNTRLTLTAKNDITNAIVELCNWPLRFSAPPGPLSTMRGKMDVYEMLMPSDLVQSFKTNYQWGYTAPLASSAKLGVRLDGEVRMLHLGNEMGVGEQITHPGYIQATTKVRSEHWATTQFPVIETPHTFFGSASSEVVDWMRTSHQDSVEALHTIKVLTKDLLEMCVTAGQMRRMVPELLKYLPADKVACLHNQVRASSLPYEWAAYPREDVDRATTYMAKCHMLTGLGNNVRQRISRDDYATRMLGI